MAPRITRRTTHLKPSKVDDKDVIHKSLPQWVPAATRTADEIKAWLSANAKARRHRRPLPGYSEAQLADIEERAAKAMRVAPQELKDNGGQRTDAAKATKQYWNRIAKPVFEAGGNKKEAANFVVERTGAKYSTVYRALKKPK
jgi:hypothetical protein